MQQYSGISFSKGYLIEQLMIQLSVIIFKNSVCVVGGWGGGLANAQEGKISGANYIGPGWFMEICVHANCNIGLTVTPDVSSRVYPKSCK